MISKELKLLFLGICIVILSGILIYTGIINREAVRSALGIQLESVSQDPTDESVLCLQLKQQNQQLAREFLVLRDGVVSTFLAILEDKMKCLYSQNSKNQQSWIEGYWQGIADSSCSRIIDEWCPDYDYTVEDYDDKVESREWLIRLRIKLCLSSWTPEEKVSCIEDIVAHAPY